MDFVRNMYFASQIFWTVIGISVFVVSDGSPVTVHSPFGVIQGVKKTDKDTGLSYVSFKGIPYAKPPLGDLRFAKPQPHPKLNSIFDATKDDRIVCPHIDQLTYNEKNFVEDCLVLNILTKDVGSTKTLKKVLVFIHGGGFFAWTAYFFEAKSFVNSEDVIVVTINYRLGVLGFLSTENDASPGNYGLWDQTLALRWVKDNILAFGGDPEDITIAGESAGGASVGYLSISPYTKGLFTKAYLQSGTATSVFARALDPQSDALKLAKATGCWDEEMVKEINLKDSTSIVECLKKLPYAAFAGHVGLSLDSFLFVPSVDNDFIPDMPLKLLGDDGYLDDIGFFNRSYLVGIDNNELDFVGLIASVGESRISMKATTKQEKDLAVQHFFTRSRDVALRSRFESEGAMDNRAIIDIISNFYNKRYKNDFEPFLQMISDINFLAPSLDFMIAASRRQTCNVFFFHFDHYPGYMKGSPKGIIHAADLPYWFDIELENLSAIFGFGIEGEMDKVDLEVKKLFSSVIGEFIRTGDPGLALKHILPSGWPKYDVQKSHYLNFNLNPWISNFLEKDKQNLWFKTVPKLFKKKHVHSEL